MRLGVLHDEMGLCITYVLVVWRMRGKRDTQNANTNARLSSFLQGKQTPEWGGRKGLGPLRGRPCASAGAAYCTLSIYLRDYREKKVIVGAMLFVFPRFQNS